MKLLINKILLFLFIGLASFSDLSAQNVDKTNRHLIINLYEEAPKFYSFEDIVNISPAGDQIVLNLSDISEIFLLSDLESIGIVYEEAEDSGISGLETDSGTWKIYDLRGNLIREGEKSRPILSGLKKGGIYIVSINGKSFKYMPYR